MSDGNRARPSGKSGAGGGRRREGGGKRRRRRKKGGGAKEARQFWGDPAKLPPFEATVRISADPTAVVRSLGRPPLSGQEHAAGIYFEALYDRAVMMGSALAAAGGLIEPEDLLGEVDEAS